MHTLREMSGVAPEHHSSGYQPSKPSPLVRGRSGIIDFGIAEAEKRLTETASGVIKGKFYYMSPEQASAKSIDHRSDVFSAGIVLYEALVAAPLYDDEEDSGKLLKRVQEADIAPPSTLRGGIPQKVEDVLMRALHRDRNPAFRPPLIFIGP